jgi:hypothetical protein
MITHREHSKFSWEHAPLAANSSSRLADTRDGGAPPKALIDGDVCRIIAKKIVHCNNFISYFSI